MIPWPGNSYPRLPYPWFLIQVLTGWIVCLVLLSCSPPSQLQIPEPEPTPSPVPEQVITLLPLQGPLTEPEAELSGLAWFQDTLVLLPQYPHMWNHSVFGLHRHDIAAVLDGSKHALNPFPIPLSSSPPLYRLAGYEGLEAIAFDGNRVYVTVEARMRDYMQGYLLQGTIQEQDANLQITLNGPAVLAPQTYLMNQAYETLLLWQNQIITLYEVNGTDINPGRAALVHDDQLQPQPAWTVPAIEYRITDATQPDAQGRFWAVNFHWPGNKRLMPTTDALQQQWGEGSSHTQTDIVERILALQIREGAIVLQDKPPLYMALLDNVVARNWEGIVRWDEHGFLLVTDQFPTTLLAHVAQ